MALVYSTKAHANIVSIDFSDALKMTGVHGHVTHDDIPGAKLVGSIVHDEEMFASKTVSFFCFLFFFWQNLHFTLICLIFALVVNLLNFVQNSWKQCHYD